jgi:hypothetical protein
MQFVLVLLLVLEFMGFEGDDCEFWVQPQLQMLPALLRLVGCSIL